MSNPHSTAKSGKRADLNNQFFRSKTEANYARFLNLFNVHWKYEPKTFEFKDIARGTRFYTPDFYLFKEDRWVEVKGWMDQKSATKLKRFRKYHPLEFDKLTLVTADRETKREAIKIGIKDIEPFNEIKKKFSHIIPNWER